MPKKKQCPSCNGKGGETHYIVGYGDHWEKCYKCYGEGVITDYDDEDSGKNDTEC